MYCSRCGTPNADQAKFCEKCGQTLNSAAATTSPAANGYGAAAAPAFSAGPTVAPAPQPAWQPPPQAYADPRVRGTAPGYPATPSPNNAAGKTFAVGRNPTVALLLSLFLPAIGQFYNGDTKKGLAMLGGYVVGFLLLFVYIGALVNLGIWIWSMVDAYNVASGKAPLW